VKLNPDIFKAYDIRGVYPDDIDEAGAKAIGTAFATYLGSREIAVGHDMRLSSPSLTAAFIDGVTEQGVDVSDYGLLSTDMMYFAVASGNHSGGAQITASHNPKQYNGAKLVREGAFPLSGDAGINDIRDMITGGELPAPAGESHPRQSCRGCR
jgi:phosphomannomutase